MNFVTNENKDFELNKMLSFHWYKFNFVKTVILVN